MCPQVRGACYRMEIWVPVLYMAREHREEMGPRALGISKKGVIVGIASGGQ